MQVGPQSSHHHKRKPSCDGAGQREDDPQVEMRVQFRVDLDLSAGNNLWIRQQHDPEHGSDTTDVLHVVELLPVENASDHHCRDWLRPEEHHCKRQREKSQRYYLRNRRDSAVHAPHDQRAELVLWHGQHVHTFAKRQDRGADSHSERTKDNDLQVRELSVAEDEFIHDVHRG